MPEPNKGKDGADYVMISAADLQLLPSNCTAMSLAQPTALPDADTIAKASALNVLDPSGNMLSFGSIFEEQRTIVVFIRESIYYLLGLYLLVDMEYNQVTSSVA